MTHKVFRDAIHDMIALDREEGGPAADPVAWGDALLLDLIDTPPVQRLRRIRQLGTTSRVYPTAEHSRFSHALGVMHLAKRILHVLGTQTGVVIDRVVALQVKVAALLHDLGHGPYSHLFEAIFGAVADHEALGWRMIVEPGAVRTVIEQHCHRLGVEQAVFFQGLAGILGGREHSGQAVATFGRQIISSQLDADRMDYLLRDAYFTGVTYGHYDLEWLLHSLRLCDVTGTPRLCVDIARGPTALESYIAARDNMYRQVYHHKTARALDALLGHLFAVLLWGRETLGVYPPGTPPELSRYLEEVRRYDGSPPALALLLALDDAVVDYAVNHWANDLPDHPLPWAELRWKSRLFRERQPLYRRLRWYTNGLGGNRPATCSDVIDDPEFARVVDAFFSAQAATLLPVASAVGEGTQMLPLRFLVKVDSVEHTPYAQLRYTADLPDPVFVRHGPAPAMSAEHASNLINFFGHHPQRLVRVFVDPRAHVGVVELLRATFRYPDRVADLPTARQL
ncbi:MAG: HD domain-containing protein [Magnetococcales bacterium]|nr:HD domain-containing protein [Magnetococcales bacterium]